MYVLLYRVHGSPCCDAVFLHMGVHDTARTADFGSPSQTSMPLAKFLHFSTSSRKSSGHSESKYISSPVRG